MRNQMQPSDIQFYYKTNNYNKMNDFFSNHGLRNHEIQLLLALFGVNNGNKVDIHTNDGSDKREISRTVFSKAVAEMERDFGLITIVDSYKEPYLDVLNKKAFLKNANKGKYLDLPNVSTFYGYFLGGIEPLESVVGAYGNQESDIFDSILEYLDDNEDIINSVANKVKTVEL